MKFIACHVISVAVAMVMASEHITSDGHHGSGHSKGGCVLPTIANGVTDATDYTSLIPDGHSVEVACNKGYELAVNGLNKIRCNNTKIDTELPRCVRSKVNFDELDMMGSMVKHGEKSAYDENPLDEREKNDGPSSKPSILVTMATMVAARLYHLYH